MFICHVYLAFHRALLYPGVGDMGRWEKKRSGWESGDGGGECIYRGLEGLRPWESALREKLHSCLSAASLGGFSLVLSRLPGS